MKSILVLLTAAMLLGACAGVGVCGTNLYGLTGLIETPDDQVVAPSGVTFAGRYVADVGDSNANLTSYGGTIGIIPKLEIGAVALDFGVQGSKAEGILSLKYRAMDESIDRPSITVGVVDIANRFDKMSSIDNPSAFVVVGRNLTGMAESLGGWVSKPLKGTVGFGTGLYEGVFLGLDWSASEKIDFLAEYVSNGVRQEGTFNAGVRMNAVGGLSLELGALDLKDFYGGLSYTLSTY